MDFDLETEWPELMKLLTPPQYFAIRRAIAAAWHEGWDPNLMDVELLVRYIRDEGELPLPAPIDGPETEYVFDTWDSYFQLGDLGLPVFINYYNETNPRLLQHKEFLAVCARSIELDLGLATIDPTFDAAHLQTIHYYLFGDVYPWAGRFRTVNMSKPGGVAFADCQNGEVERYLDDVHRIAVETPWYQLSGLQFVEKSAELFAYLNQAHPFREGNGRAAKAFMCAVAAGSPYDFDFMRVNPMVWNQASAGSSPEPFEYHPHPEALVPVFDAVTISR